GGPHPRRRRQPHAPLWPAPGRWRRAARARDPSRGVPVIERRRLILVLAALGAALAVTAVAATFLGSARVSPGDVLAVLSGRADASRTESVVIWGVRLPRIAAAVLAGGALAVAGTGLQGLPRNPLAGPAGLGLAG